MNKNQKSGEALIASENRYRRLFETAQDGILILDAETGMIMDVNPFLIKLLGYDKDQFLEKAIWEIGFFKDILANRENFLELQQNEYIRYEDLPLKTAEGRKINVEFVSNVYLVNHHKVIQCNIRDITDRKMTESRIILTTKILSLLNTTIPFHDTIEQILLHIQHAFSFDAIGIRFKEGDDYPYFLHKGFNEDFLRHENTLLGRTAAGVVCIGPNGNACLECTCGLVISGKTDPASHLFTEGGSFWTNNSSLLLELPADQDPRNNPRNRCMYEGFHSIALVPIHHAGNIVGLLQLNDKKKNSFSPILLKYFEGIGEIIGVALMRKKEEQTLRASEALYRDLVEKSLDGVYSSTHEGKFVEVNPAMVEMLGYASKEDLMGIEIKKQLYFAPADRESMIMQEMREETGVYRLKKKDGSEIWVEDHAWHDFDENGNILFHKGILRDVTDRKHAEDEIHKLNETLEERIGERTRQLESTNKKLEFHISEIEQFGYITNHDLQEPLRTIIQFTELLKEEYSDKLDADGKKYIDFIHRSGSRMNELVKDLRAYSFIGQDSCTVHVDCNKMVDDVLDDLGNSIQNSKAIITVGILPSICAFETELRLVFQNLINNAIKFRKKDDIPEITITAENFEDEWLFKVADKGIGIETKDLVKIFIIFQRLHNRSEYDGTGIGLAHCKKAVEMHGGKIWVESTPSKGSVFAFSIPKTQTCV